MGPVVLNKASPFIKGNSGDNVLSGLQLSTEI